MADSFGSAFEKSKECDLLAFVPLDDETISIDGWKMDSENEGIKHESLDGFLYHIFLYYKNRENVIVEDEFEATLLHPLTYIQQLRGTNIFGFILKKTKISKEKYDKYVTGLRASNYFMKDV